MSKPTCECQRTIFRSLFFLSPMWALGMEVKYSVLVAKLLYLPSHLASSIGEFLKSQHKRRMEPSKKQKR